MASANISFETIPSSIRKPGKYIEFNTKLAVRTLPANAQRVLVVAQQLAARSAPTAPVQVYSDADAAALCGEGSQAHRMARAAIKAYRYLDLSILPIVDPTASIAAAGTITLAGTATGAGVVSVYIAGEAVAIAVAVDDTAASTATALAAAVNAEPALPVSAAAASGVVTLTAKNKGTCGNSITLSGATSVPGLTLTVAAMSGGQTSADITDALAAVFAEHYQIIVLPWAEAAPLAALKAHLDAAGHALEQRGAIGVAASTGTLSAATTLAEGVNAGRITVALLPGTDSQPCEVAAAYAAVLASEEDPARPLNTLALTGIQTPPVSARLSRTEQETALKNGITPLETGSGETVRIVRAVSTYTKNAEDVDDVSLLDITTMRTLDYVRKAVRERVSLRFPREKLSSRTPAKVRSEILDVLRKLESLEIVEDVEANADGVICERDAQDANRLNARIPTDVVNGLHVFAGRIDLLL